MTVVKSFFVLGKLLKEVNATILSWCRKKLTLLVWGIIGPLLAAMFIPSRSISKNILLAQEVVRDYHKNEGKPRCTLKVDLMKAYDSVNWDFMMHCLFCFGFPAKFISRIKECVTSPRFSIALNGTLVGYFEERKGLRQGDPFTPYLFVLVMQVLSNLMEDYVRMNPDF